MCILVSSPREIDILWLAQVIRICPKGMLAEPELEIHVHCLVCPRYNKKASATFLHCGEIYALQNRSQEWLATSGPDWPPVKIFNRRELPDRWVKPLEGDKVSIRYTRLAPPLPALVTKSGEVTISDINVFYIKRTDRHPIQEMPQSRSFKESIFSTFSVVFERPELQLFQVSFSTHFGILHAGGTLNVEVEGPENTILGVRSDIANSVHQFDRRAELRHLVDYFYSNVLMPKYDIAVVPHPSLALIVEDRQNIDPPITFAVDWKGALTDSACCTTRVVFFDIKQRGFLARLLATPVPFTTESSDTARTDKLMKLGHIVDHRIKVIKSLEHLKDDPDTPESAFQKLVAKEPWLINPQWSFLTANQAFKTLKEEFQKFYKTRTGSELELDDFALPNKRADFVLLSESNAIQIVEIKKPNHSLNNDEMMRINTYKDIMTEFLESAGNEEFQRAFPEFHITIVCDKISLTGVHKSAFDGLKNEGKLVHRTWRAFLLMVRKMHEPYLNEVDKQD